MAAAAAAIPLSSSSSASNSFCNKHSHLSCDFYSLATTARVPSNHFTSKAKPIKTLKLKARLYPFSLLARPLFFRASVAFDSIDSVTQDDEGSEAPESEAEQAEDEEIDGEEQTENLSADAARLYVGNLPYSMTNSDLAEVFGEAGRVAAAQVVYDRVTDRSRGFAFVTMGSTEEAKEAIRMFDGSQIGGRTVKVNFPEVPRGGEREVMVPKMRNSYQGFIDSPHKIYAGNLSWGLTSQGLKEAFGDQTGVLSAKVIYDRDTGRSRGFGFVTFSSAQEAESALSAMNEVEVEGRPFKLNMAADRATPSTATPETSFDSSMLRKHW